MNRDCSDFDAALAALGTPALGAEEEQRVRAHLSRCARCAELARLLNSDAELTSSPPAAPSRSPEWMRRGTVIAHRYRLERLLGRGGMGVVWAAVQEPTGQPVAIKLLRQDLADARTRRRVIREARAACAVRHPNVVRVLDVIETDEGSPALVMESLEGHTLQRRFDRGVVGVGQLCHVLGGVAAGIEAAHGASIVHRDLKPDNVFLARSLASVEVKVLDFGVAKLGARGHEPTATLTRTGAMVGTPFYMAPEQVLGEADVDARADVWALGLMLYQGLTGVLPTRGDNLGQVIKAVTITPFAPVARLAPGLPADLAALIDDMLAKDRDHRAVDLALIRAVLARHADPSIDPAPQLDDLGAAELPTTREPLPVEAPAARRRRTLGARASVAVGIALIAVAAGGVAARRPPAGAASAPSSSATVSATVDSVLTTGPALASVSAASSSTPTLPIAAAPAPVARPRAARGTATSSASAAPLTRDREASPSAIGVEREF